MAEPLDIFWIGNSHTRWFAGTSTAFNGGAAPGMADLVSKFAVHAGYDAPNNYWHVVDGSFLSARVPILDALVNDAIPAGVTIDKLVMQGHSTESVAELGGNAATFGMNARTIEQGFRSGNNGAIDTVLYQTWAREGTHPNYQAQGGAVESPQVWHDQTRQSYIDAAAGINANGGDASLARVGDAWASENWANYLYRDGNHYSREGGVLTAAILFASLYGNTVSDLDINLTTPDELLEFELRALGLNQTEWEALAGIADSVIPAPASSLLLVGVAGIAVRRRR